MKIKIINKKAQVMVEFLFCLMVLLFMIYGVIEVFRWTGSDVAKARKAHDALLIVNGTSKEQLVTDFYTPSPFKAIVGQD